ncbi:MAG: hypothetical protein H0Z33_07820 [Bacillaceae bacterium]|nr:hypothetical protein [Bacillaceae bacterium]
MSRSEQMRTNAIYIIFLIAATIGIPLLIVLGTIGTNVFMEGIFAAVLSFIIMGSYVLYTILLGKRNS